MSTGDHQRTSRKKDRTSSTNNAGCSNAAKWPPLAGSSQYRMFGNGAPPTAGMGAAVIGR